MRNFFHRTRSDNTSQRESNAGGTSRGASPAKGEKSRNAQPEVWKLALELGFTEAQVEAALKRGHQSSEHIVDYILTHQVRPDGTIAGSSGRSRPPETDSGRNSPRDLGSMRPQLAETTEPTSAENDELQRALELSRLEYLKSGRGITSLGPENIKSASTTDPKPENPLGLATDSELQRAIEASLEEERKSRQRFELSIFHPEANVQKRLRESLTEPIGLCNVGNTCYLNSLLQVYYHLPFFVRRVFSWRENQVDMTKTQPKAIDIVRELQRLFASLGLSERSYADPSGVLCALADTLNAAALELGAQQDLSEFNETFLRSIETALRAGNEQEPLQRAFIHSFVQELHYQVKVENLDVDMDSGTRDDGAIQSTEGDASPRTPDAVSATRLEAMVERLSLLQSAESRLAHRVEGTTSSLILDVASGTCRDLYAALDEYVLAAVEYQPEQQNAVTGSAGGVDEPGSTTETPAAGKSQIATKSVWFRHFAPVLFIYLQRVRFNMDTRKAEKVNDGFDFAESICLDRYLERCRSEALSARLQEARLRLHYEQLERERLQLLQLPGVREPADLIYEAVLQRLRESEPKGNASSTTRLDETQRMYREQALEHLSHVYVAEKQHREWIETEMARLKDEMMMAYASLASERYRLHAVLVHEGAPETGHYFVFIRADQEPVWYEFNDQLVRRVPWEHVHAVGRGGNGTASAYALIYRRDNEAEPSSLPTAEEARRLLPDSILSQITSDNAALKEDIERWKLHPAVAAIAERLRQPAADETFYERAEWFCLHRGQVAEAVLLATCEVDAQRCDGTSMLVRLAQLQDPGTKPWSSEEAAEIYRFLDVMEATASGPFAEDIRQLAVTLRQANGAALRRLENTRCQAEQAHRVAVRALLLTGIAFEWLEQRLWRNAASAITTIYETASAGISFAGLTESLRFCVERLVRETETLDPELSSWIAYEYLPERTGHAASLAKANAGSVEPSDGARLPKMPDERGSVQQSSIQAPTRPALPPWDEGVLDVKRLHFGGEDRAIRWFLQLIRGQSSQNR